MFLKFRREGHSFSLKDWDFLSKRLKQLVNWQSMVTLASSNAPINVMPAVGEAGHRVGIWLFFHLQSNSLPTGKLFQSNGTKFPHPRLHIAVNPKA